MDNLNPFESKYEVTILYMFGGYKVAAFHSKVYCIWTVYGGEVSFPPPKRKQEETRNLMVSMQTVVAASYAGGLKGFQALNL